MWSVSTSTRCRTGADSTTSGRSEEHTSELQSQSNLVCRLLLEKKKITCSTQSERRYQSVSSHNSLHVETKRHDDHELNITHQPRSHIAKCYPVHPHDHYMVQH